MKKFIYCEICGKSTSVGYNRPKSQHKTKRLIQPNVQKWNGLVICTRCRRIISKKFTPASKQA